MARPPAVRIDLPPGVRHAASVRMQEAFVAARQAGEIPDVVFFLEHHPVITLGRRARSNFLLAKPETLARYGIDLEIASRGGDVTWHGPGQIVVYPILHLGAAEADTHGYLTNLEEVAIRTAADFGVEAWRREGMNGAWTKDGKIAAIGFHIKRWVTLHGMSFNVRPDLAGFDLIVGCGLVGERVSSLEKLLGSACPTIDAARDRLAHHLSDRCGREFVPASAFPTVGKLLAQFSNDWNRPAGA